MADERNEQSVLISLDSLTADQGDSSSGAAAGGESGLIDIGALESAGLLDDMPAAGVAGPSAAVAPASAGAVKARRRGIHPMVWVVAGLLLVGGSVFATLQYVGAQKEAEKLAADAKAKAEADVAAAKLKAAEAEAAAAKAAAAAAAAKVPDAATTAAAKTPDAGATAAAKVPDAGTAVAKGKGRKWRPKGKRPNKPTEKPAAAAAPVAAAPAVAAAPPKKPAKPKTDEADDLLNALSGAKPAGNPGADPAKGPEASDPLLPKSLKRGQILTVVRKNAAQVRKCKQEAGGESGVVRVKVSIAGSGSVKSAKVVSAQKGTALGACVERKVRVFRFPQFSDSVMSMTLPFSI